MRKYAFVILFLLLSCNPNQPIPQNTIVVGVDRYPENHDPRLPTDSVSQKINQLIHNGLLTINDKLELVPQLATYELLDTKTYQFTLKPGIYFHHGKKLTSADVKATYESMLDSELHSPFKSSLSIIEKIDTPDEKTIIFRLKKPNAPFLTLMSLGILPQDFIQEKNADAIKIPGCGPYEIFETSQGINKVTLKRFEKYYGQSAKTKWLTFRVIQDATLRSLELLKGRIDLLQNGVPYVLINRLKEEHHLKSRTSAGINFTYMAFNLKNDYLKHLKVRKAMALSIDRDRLIIYKLSRLASKATSLLSPEHWASIKLPHYRQNISAAKKLLDEAGFTDPDGDGPKPRFKLTYKTSAVKERIEIAQLIAQNLGEIGIEVKVKSHEFGTFYRDIRQGAFDIYTLTWVGLTDPDIYHFVFHSDSFAPNGGNRGYYKNDLVDKLIDASRIETDANKRLLHYQVIQKQVYNDFPYAPLWYENNFVIMNKSIQGFKLVPNASYVGLVNAWKSPE
jgi:peptide/nickel transport system substrate-binding protein